MPLTFHTSLAIAPVNAIPKISHLYMHALLPVNNSGIILDGAL